MTANASTNTSQDTSTHNVDALRSRLFGAIDAVKAGTMSTEQARTIGDLAQVIVNATKVEIDFARQAERKTVPFLTQAQAQQAGTEHPRPGLTRKPGEGNGILSITQHALQG